MRQTSAPDKRARQVRQTSAPDKRARLVRQTSAPDERARQARQTSAPDKWRQRKRNAPDKCTRRMRQTSALDTAETFVDLLQVQLLPTTADYGSTVRLCRLLHVMLCFSKIQSTLTTYTPHRCDTAEDKPLLLLRLNNAADAALAGMTTLPLLPMLLLLLLLLPRPKLHHPAVPLVNQDQVTLDLGRVGLHVGVKLHDPIITGGEDGVVVATVAERLSVREAVRQDAGNDEKPILGK